MATLSDMLTEARQAYHDLQTGQSVVSVRDSNGEEVRYAKADHLALFAYIQSLDKQLNPTSGVTGPMGFRF